MKGIWKTDSQWTNVDADFAVDDLKELPLLVEHLMKEIELT